MENYHLIINGKPHHVDKEIITGEELLKVIGIVYPAEFEILERKSTEEWAPVEQAQPVKLKKEQPNEFNVRHYREVSLFLDDEEYPFTEIFMTPKAIMGLAELNPQTHYLKQILGHTDITYKNDPDHIIGMRNGMKFSSCKIASTPVS